MKAYLAFTNAALLQLCSFNFDSSELTGLIFTCSSLLWAVLGGMEFMEERK